MTEAKALPISTSLPHMGSRSGPADLHKPNVRYLPPVDFVDGVQRPTTVLVIRGPDPYLRARMNKHPTHPIPNLAALITAILRKDRNCGELARDKLRISMHVSNYKVWISPPAGCEWSQETRDEIQSIVQRLMGDAALYLEITLEDLSAHERLDGETQLADFRERLRFG